MYQLRKLKLALPALLFLAACSEQKQPQAQVQVQPQPTETFELPADSIASLDSTVATEIETEAARIRSFEQAAARWISLRPYLVLADPDPDQLSLLVSARLRQGYQLRGPMYTHRKTLPGTNSGQEVMYIQNLVLLDSLRVKTENGYRTSPEE
jgi:hypothetical protein